ncbi:hypothetical protein SCP_0903520 [Sparassis crispa]|uniref:DUF4219 domain-containing protein n=1 Tax=Sparassis crispa TaxID=139825 RepID=A0A401GWB0_9APHY|nr:hypothetical protein SCP_0903520 [Sparassis crispa]GBE86473.1 hypothetical protein SCP_0903520 [Sparassis crispa]
MPEHDSRIPKLVKGNCIEWSALMKVHLVTADLWEVVGPEEEKLVARGLKGVAAKKKKREQVYSKILMNLSPPQMAFVLGSENPQEAWAALEETHRSASVNSILSLHRHFFRMMKVESESIMTWISRVHTAALELSRTPYPTTELDIIMVISDGLSDEYQPVINALDSLPFEELKLFAVTMWITGLEAQLAHSKEKASEVTVAYYVAQSRRDGHGL